MSAAMKLIPFEALAAKVSTSVDARFGAWKKPASSRNALLSAPRDTRGSKPRLTRSSQAALPLGNPRQRDTPKRNDPHVGKRTGRNAYG
jgi:hypothetical protein